MIRKQKVKQKVDMKMVRSLSLNCETSPVESLRVAFWVRYCS